MFLLKIQVSGLNSSSKKIDPSISLSQWHWQLSAGTDLSLELLYLLIYYRLDLILIGIGQCESSLRFMAIN